jgi:hypothetical protein
MMRDYRVTWEIDVTAENPTKAAKEALDIQRDGGSLATVFGVTDSRTAVCTEVIVATKKGV